MELSQITAAGGVAMEGRPGEAHLRGADDARSLVEACWSHGARALLLYAANMSPRFFDLSSGEAGAILQTLQNYRLRLALVCPPGEVVLSSRFAELMTEEQRGRDFGLFPTRAEALAWLGDTADG